MLLRRTALRASGYGDDNELVCVVVVGRACIVTSNGLHDCNDDNHRTARPHKGTMRGGRPGLTSSLGLIGLSPKCICRHGVRISDERPSLFR